LIPSQQKVNTHPQNKLATEFSDSRTLPAYFSLAFLMYKMHRLLWWIMLNVKETTLPTQAGAAAGA